MSRIAHLIDTARIEALRDAIRAQYPDDDDLLADMIEGETDAIDLIDRLHDEAEEARTMASALKDREREMAERRARMEQRQEARKEAIDRIMRVIGLEKIERPMATFSFRRNPPRLVVRDPGLVPDDLCRIERKPLLAEIRKAGDVPGVEWTNGGTSLSIRRK